MLTVSRIEGKIKTDNRLLIGADVDKGFLNFYSEFTANDELSRVEARSVNNTRALKMKMKEFEELAAQYGFTTLALAMEPSGGFEKRWLELAHARGHQTHYVSGEATSKASVIESNDISKSDPKDARTVFRLAAMGRVLVCQKLPEPYATLRALNGFYEDAEREVVILKTRVSSVMDKLFPDCELDRIDIYTPFGRWLLDNFGFNPQRIAKQKRASFIAFARKAGMRVETDKLKKTHNSAISAMGRELPEHMGKLYEDELTSLLRRIELSSQRKAELRTRILATYQGSPEYERLKGVDGTKEGFLIARLIAETGPLTGFSTARQLLRFVGLNLKQRQSGKCVGKRKLSKKGRALARKVIYQIVYGSLIRKGHLFSERYALKRDVMRNGLKAIAALMRKFVSMAFGLYRSGAPFNPERVFRCNIISTPVFNH